VAAGPRVGSDQVAAVAGRGGDGLRPDPGRQGGGADREQCERLHATRMAYRAGQVHPLGRAAPMTSTVLDRRRWLGGTTQVNRPTL
jgi:hypothetical protein